MTLIPKKSLGQHFLNSRQVLEQIIQTAKIQPGETVLEIGPGTGILTSALLESGANVIAIEKDDRAFALLQEKYAEQISSDELKLIHGDILFTQIDSHIDHSDIYKIVANIPYYITGAILEKFLENTPRPALIIRISSYTTAIRVVLRHQVPQ